MSIVLRNMLVTFIVTFWFMATIVIISLPNILEVSKFWFLLSLPGGAAWAAFWLTLAYHYDNKGVEL